ncbi:MAG: winged helix-turn-helix domain-containing protein, partial [Spirochaetota bacterium]
MTHHNVSDINTTRVLRSVWLNPGISRVEISKRLNLNKSTV